MGSRRQEMRDMVRTVLSEFDIQDVVFGKRRSHQMAQFTFHGRPMRFLFASTPSDRKSLVYNRTLLRRLLRAEE